MRNSIKHTSCETSWGKRLGLILLTMLSLQFQPKCHTPHWMVHSLCHSFPLAAPDNCIYMGKIMFSSCNKQIYFGLQCSITLWDVAQPTKTYENANIGLHPKVLLSTQAFESICRRLGSKAGIKYGSHVHISKNGFVSHLQPICCYWASLGRRDGNGSEQSRHQICPIPFLYCRRCAGFQWVYSESNLRSGSRLSKGPSGSTNFCVCITIF